MKKGIAFIGIVMLPLSVFSQVGLTPHFIDTLGAPILEIVGSRDYNFGTVLVGNRVEHVFDFINKGNRPLIIRQINPNGYPGSASWSREPVLPGGFGRIRCSYETSMSVRPSEIAKMFDPIYNPGKVDQSFWIVSNARNGDSTGRIRLTIAGVVSPLPQVDSARAH